MTRTLTPWMTGAIAVCSLSGLAALSAFSGPCARTLPDEPSASDSPIGRWLAPGGRHRYELRLAGGEFAQISVEQRSTDVAVEVADPGGHAIAEFDDEPGARACEEATLVAERTGIYSVTVRPSSATTHAGSYFIRLAVRRAATEGDRAEQQSRTLRTDAARLAAAGRFDEARRRFEQALTLAEQIPGHADRDIGRLSLQLAGNALAMRDDARARQLAVRAAAIFDPADVGDDVFAARARTFIATTHQHAGEVAQAEAVLQPTLAVFARTLGPDHPWSIDSLTAQASIRYDAGDVESAESLNRRAMAMLEAAGDTKGIPYAVLLNNLGQVLQQKGQMAQAETLFLRSLANAERLEGVRSYRVTTTLQNLGIVARQRGDYGQALEYDTRALFVRQALLGPEHADMAPLLNNLAVLYRSVGDERHALPMLFRALAIRERTVGPYHRGTLTTVGNIARSYASIGDMPHAIEFERRADAIVETQLALNLSVGSERQKLAFVRSVAERTDRAISLHLDRAPTDPDAAGLAALVLLQRKGRVQDSMADVFGVVRSRVTDAGDRADMDRLNETRRRLAQAALGAATLASREARQTFATMEAEAERLEASLSAHSAEYRAQMQSVSLAAVQEVLPDEAALIEYAVYRPFHPDAAKRDNEYESARYAAYVIRPNRGPAGVDLGDARTIDRAVEVLRDALRDPTIAEAEVKARAAALFDLVVRPLSTALDGASRLVISPDGHLSLVPFEALVGEDGCYVVERYATSYVTSGRDLLRMRLPPRAPTDPVIVADPSFGDPPAAAADAARRPRSGQPQTSTTGTLGAIAYFSPLAASGHEARAIKALFPHARLLTGTEATKESVRRLSAPRVLHIASHAFFLDDAPAAAAGASANPLIRSGLALAGANAKPDRADGVLTALEASGMDLWGTELVTLSACDTGVGEVHNGEGVYGLRRAFVLAGAQSLVMTLWPVSDYVARDTMVAYYTGLRDGLGRGDALRQAKLAVLQQAGRRHPYFWAGFIQSGQWTPLRAAPTTDASVPARAGGTL